MNVLQKLSDAKLAREASRLEEVQAELARRAEDREHAKEIAEAKAARERDAAKVATLSALKTSTEAEIEEETAVLDGGLRALRAHERRDALLVRHAGIVAELRACGEIVPEPTFTPLSEEAIRTAQDVWTSLGISLGVAVTSRPLLTYR